MTLGPDELERANSPHAEGRPTRGRLPQLDGVRALAVLLVLVHHAIVPIDFGGYVGVDVFFVMSGYLITGILLGELDRYGRVRLRRFYARRLIRLYPPLLLVVLVLFIPGLLLTTWVLGYLINTGAALTYTTPVLEQLGRSFGPWRHTWTLGVEEIFYLAWPAALMIGTRWTASRTIRASMALAVGGALLVAGVVFGPMTIFRGAGLFFGCALAIFLHRQVVRVPGQLAVVGLIGIVGAAFFGSSTALMSWAIALCCISSTLLIGYLATDSSGRLSRFFALRPFAYFGLISYEIYLWHYPLIRLSSEALNVPPIAFGWVAVPIAVLLAAMTHRVLEQPLDRLRGRLPSTPR